MSAKKVGILNFQYSEHNYGAVLQAAALEYTLNDMGYEAQHIDYRPAPASFFRSNVGRILRKLGVRKVSQRSEVNNKEAFERFRKKHIKRTKLIKHKNDFRHISKSFDAIVVGSDQVWRPSMSTNVLGFFLTYASNEVERISYAASFGEDTWELDHDIHITSLVKKELKKFKAISCREISGVEICKNVFDVNATHVLDPLLLVKDSFIYDLVGDEPVEANPVVYYKLDYDEVFEDNLKIVGKLYNTKPQDIYLKKGSNPEFQEVSTWITYIYNSKAVVTDSYHCVCLALRFGKVVYYAPNEKRGQSRFDSLFKVFGIKPVLCKEKNITSIYKLEVSSDINEALRHKREISKSYLLDSLLL